MVEARSLLRATASQRDVVAEKIHDRWASYHPKTGALRCSACDMLTVKHERLWGNHLASKTHRERVKQIEQQAENARHEPESGKGQQANDAHPESASFTKDPAEVRKRKDTEESDADVKRTKHESPAQMDAVSLDQEWQAFQNSLKQSEATMNHTYEHATISVEPELGREQLDESVQNETEEERRSRLQREEREDILARIDAERQAQAEADDRYVRQLTH